MPEFSLAHLTVLKCAPPEMIKIAADAGYEYVSMRPIGMKLPGEPNYSFADSPELMRETKAALKDTGVRFHDLELGRLGDGLDPRNYERDIAASAELGAKAMISSAWSTNRQQNIDQYGTLCDIAKQYNITVDLELVCIAAVNTLAGVIDIVRSANRSNSGLMIDIMHFWAAGEKPADLAALPADWFHFMHLCDVPAKLPAEREPLIEIVRDARLYCGEGGADVKGILNALPAKTVYSIELPNLKRVQELGYGGHAKRCLTTAKEYCATNGVTGRK